MYLGIETKTEMKPNTEMVLEIRTGRQGKVAESNVDMDLKETIMTMTMKAKMKKMKVEVKKMKINSG